LTNLADFTENDNQYLLEDGVWYAITSVTGAITNVQSQRQGFSYLQLMATVSRAEHDERLAEVTGPTIRPGRPLLMPLNYENHFVLLNIQPDTEGVTTISILDSLRYHSTPARRAQMYEAALRLIRATNWAKGATTENAPQFPSHATYIRCAQQPKLWECGYYTIFNAWALALGLELDEGFMPREDFFRTGRDMIRYARGGLLDWRAIYAFLRCQGMVTDARQVPLVRRFSQTQSVLGPADLREYLEDLQFRDMMYWSNPGQYDLFEIGQLSRVPLPPQGVPHTTLFPSDGWSDHSRIGRLGDLIDNGLLDLEFSEQALIEAYEQWRESVRPEESPQEMLQDLEQDIEDAQLARATAGQDPNWPDDVATFQQFLDGPERYLNTDQIEPDPCAYYRRRSRWLREFYRINGPTLQHAAVPTRGQELDGDQITFALEAVLGAIDRRQTPTSGNQYNGGFSLAPYIAITTAALTVNPDDLTADGYRVSRPRRCWLMPLALEGDLLEQMFDHQEKLLADVQEDRDAGHGHAILVILQEEEMENGGGTEFVFSFMNSSPDQFQNELPRDFLRPLVERAANRLGWSTHRNAQDPQVGFRDSQRDVLVANQSEHWPSGLHVVLNAWILAMGLTPAVLEANRDLGPVYTELLELIQWAYAGILDWKTLVSWLLCKRLVRGSLVDVPDNRRFESTVGQFDEEQLRMTVERLAQGEDARLASVPIATVGYDRSYNVNTAWLAAVARAPDALQRSYKDQMMVEFEHEGDGLEFLDEYEG
jgi:hypothetical protein